MQSHIIFPEEAVERPKRLNINPVYREFRRMALELINQGFDRFGAKCIMETIRYQTAVSHGPGSDFKVNNNATSLYARLFLEEFPQHEGFFELRRSKFDEVV